MVVVERCCGAPQPEPRHVTQSQSGVDRISALPDDLLLQVLDRLRCARTAARTSLLARRWRRVWRGLPKVFFRGLAPDAIHTALTQITRTSLEAIDIHVSRRMGHRRALDARSVSTLLHAAADRSPLKLVLTIPTLFLIFTVDMPRFDFATVIKLDMRGGAVRFALPPLAEFPKLETLSLLGCIMDLAALVPRCPRLRVLSITGTHDKLDIITVHSASLQELVVNTSMSDSTIDIVAPALRKLTLAMEHKDINSSLSVEAPMVEEVTWRCSYGDMDVRICEMWGVNSLEVRVVEKEELTDNDDEEGIHQPRRAHVLSLHISDNSYVDDHLEKDFAQELKEIPVTTFSVLELKITASSHALEPMLLDLLQICTAVQRLDMVLAPDEVLYSWPCDEWCPCQENDRKLGAENLTEVKIKGLKGDEKEIHCLKLLFTCAPMLRTLTLILSEKVSNDWYNTFLDTVREYPHVKSSVCISVD